jgi:hypothetical protein
VNAVPQSGRDHADQCDVRTSPVPRPARVLLALTVVSFVGVLLRNAFGVVSPIWSEAWDYLYNLTELLAVAAVALRAWKASAAERAAWFALSAGLAGFAAGDIYYTAALSGMESPPFPSPADAGYLSIYPAAYAALVLLLRARAGRVSPTLWLDGLVAALGVSAVGAALVFGVVASTRDRSQRSRRTSPTRSATSRCSPSCSP